MRFAKPIECLDCLNNGIYRYGIGWYKLSENVMGYLWIMSEQSYANYLFEKYKSKKSKTRDTKQIREVNSWNSFDKLNDLIGGSD